MPRVFPQMQPRHAFFWKYVSCWPESRSLIECADMKMHFRRAFAFARQGGPAPRAEPAQPAGRRVELRYLPFGHCIGVAPECHEHRDRRTAMLATALAMTPCYPYRVSRGDKSHRAAQAPALELSAHLVTLPFREPRLVVRSGVCGLQARGQPCSITGGSAAVLLAIDDQHRRISEADRQVSPKWRQRPE